MKKRGHDVLITATEKEISYVLLDEYEFDYKKLGTYGKKVVNKVINLPIMDIKMYDAVKNFQPDIFLGFGSIRGAHVSKLMGKTCINLDDTEHAKYEHMLFVPFTDVVLTPSCFNKNFGKKHIKFNGYIELAYTHPKYYKPHDDVLKELGLTKNDKFVVLRLVSWNAGHDIGQHGIRNTLGMIKKLEDYCQVFVSSEGMIDESIKKYQLKIAPYKMHDLLYYSSLYIGEGATMATEAALLGTPSIYVSSLAGTMGNFIELEQKYGLMYSYQEPSKALEKAIELVQKPKLKEEWKAKREKLLNDKIDITKFMVWFVENYPESARTIRENPNFQERFR